MAYQLANAPLRSFPYPHLLVGEVFPADFYAAVRAHLPGKDEMTSFRAIGRAAGGEPDTRRALPLTTEHLGKLDETRRAFWSELARWMLGGAFANLMLDKFAEIVGARTDLEGRELANEALLVQDDGDYSVGPHTGRPGSVLSLLFYLAGDAARPQLGTSVYLPGAGTPGRAGPPAFDAFQRVYTMSYLPNTLFAFASSDHSFHGVEPVADAGARRDLLLYDIYVQDAARGPAAAAAPGTPT